MNVESERAKYLAAAVLVHFDQQSGDTFLVSSILGLFNYQPVHLGEDENLSSLEEMRRIFKTLEELGYVYGYHDSYSEPRYEITDKGSDKIAEDSDNIDSLIHRYKKFGKSWLAEVLEGISSSEPPSGEDANLHVKRALKSRKISGKSEFPSFREFRSALIVALYEKSNEEGLIAYKLKELADERNIHYRDGWIDEVSNFLKGHGYALVRKSMRGDENPVAKINSSGLEYAEELIAEAESEENAPDVESPFEIAGSSDTVIDDDGIPLVTVPASDRIVKLDHNSAEYRETIVALSELSEEAKKSNEFGELFADPEDKVVVLSQIDSGIQLLKNEKVIPDVVKRVLEYPVRFIKENMPGAALGALASKVWDWLMKLFENVI